MEKFQPSANRKDDMNKPLKVRAAQIAGDTEALSAFGRAGNKTKAVRREMDQAMDERMREKNLASERRRKVEAGEDIIPLETYD